MEIFLHLGAHKTATTYLQETLSANRGLLDAHGIGFVPPSTYRPMIRHAASRDRTLNRVGVIRRARKTRSIAGIITSARRAGRRRLIISEENLLGTLDRTLTGSWFYDRCRGELGDIIRALNGHRVTAMLALRNYADFFPSAYAQALKAGTFCPFDEAMKARLLSQVRGWPEVIADIAGALPPGSKLKIWQYEAMETHEADIVAEFIGHDIRSHLVPIRERPLPGASARAIARLTRIHRLEGPPDQQRIRQVLRFNRRERGFQRFDPWSANERHVLGLRYRRDLERIAEVWPDAFVHTPLLPCRERPADVQSGVSM